LTKPFTNISAGPEKLVLISESLNKEYNLTLSAVAITYGKIATPFLSGKPTFSMYTTGAKATNKSTLDMIRS